jgi:transcriptional regulator GlxA family with amidase domain
MNFRAKPETKTRLRTASRRLGMSQSELMRRFVEALPAATTKLPKHVRVNLAA